MKRRKPKIEDESSEESERSGGTDNERSKKKNNNTELVGSESDVSRVDNNGDFDKYQGKKGQ